MRKYSLLYIALILITLLGVVNLIAVSLYLYWILWWFDNVMHFLAGFGGGFVVVWFLFDAGIFYKRPPTIFESVLGASLCLMVVGIAWEVFEYANGLTLSTEGYILDTIHDLVADTAGALSAGVIGAREIFRAEAGTILRSR